MQLLAVFYGIFIGIGLITGIGHLFLGLRRRPRDPVNLSFAVMTLLITAVIIFDSGYRFATTIEQALRLLNWGIGLIALALIALIWFVSYYTDFRPRWFLYAMSGLYLIPAVVSVASPAGILYAGDIRLAQFTLPWGEPFVQVSGTSSNWQIYNAIIFLITYVYIFYAIVRQYRAGKRRSALMLLGGIGFVVAGTAYDFLIDLGAITRSIGLYPLSYIGLTVVMSLALADDVIRSSQVQNELIENERRWRTLLEGLEQIVVGLDTEGRINYVNPYLTQVTGYVPDELLGKDWFQTFIPVQQRSEIVRTFGDILRSGLHQNYTNTILTRSGEERTIVWSNVRLYSADGMIIGSLGVGRDVTDQLAAEAALARHQDELEELVVARTAELQAANAELGRQRLSADRRRSTAEGFASILAVLNTDRPLYEILAFLTVHADQVMESSASLIVRTVGPDWQAAASTVPAEYSLATLSLCESALKLAKESGDPTGIAVSEVLSDVTNGASDTTHLLTPYCSVLAIPLFPQQSPECGMVLCYDTFMEFSQEDLDNAAILQGQIILAVENTQLREHIADQAVARERNRLSRELHDSVTQNLYSISALAEVMPELIESHPGELQHAADNLRVLATGALAEMRTLLLELRPAVLLKKNLGELLQQLADGLQSHTHTQLTVTVINDRVFPHDVQMALYRIAQEALNNVLKHSTAKQAVMGLYCEGKEVTLRIHDDGVGFTPEDRAANGFGLGNMQARAAQIHAIFELDSLPDKGTEITVVWREQGNNDNGRTA